MSKKSERRKLERINNLKGMLVETRFYNPECIGSDWVFRGSLALPVDFNRNGMAFISDQHYHLETKGIMVIFFHGTSVVNLVFQVKSAIRTGPVLRYGVEFNPTARQLVDLSFIESECRSSVRSSTNLRLSA